MRLQPESQAEPTQPEIQEFKPECDLPQRDSSFAGLSDDHPKFREPKSEASEPDSLRKLALTAGLLVTIAAATWFYGLTGANEESHPDWAQVQAAATASDNHGTTQLVHRDALGVINPVPVIEVRAADMALGIGRQVRSALIQNDPGQASEILANQFLTDPTGNAAASVNPPDLASAPDFAQAIAQGRMEFFHLQLRDCCDEDGDIVQIAVNGQPYCTVPLTHAGASISVPLSSGITTLTIIGVQDGGGGITMQCSTSRGDYFAQDIAVGQQLHLGVSAP